MFSAVSSLNPDFSDRFEAGDDDVGGAIRKFLSYQNYTVCVDKVLINEFIGLNCLFAYTTLGLRRIY